MTSRSVKPIPDMDGYGITRNGKVYSYKRGKYMSLHLTRKGYLRVTLRVNGKKKSFMVHDIVLATFDKPRPGNKQCRHLNGIRTDNRLCNLEWGSNHENSMDRWHHGTMLTGERNPACVHSNAKIERARKMYATGKYYMYTIAEKLGMSSSYVSAILSGKYRE